MTTNTIQQLQQLQIELEINNNNILNSNILTSSQCSENNNEIDNNIEIETITTTSTSTTIKSQNEIDREYIKSIKYLNRVSFCDFFFLFVPTIIIAGIIIGFPWYKIIFKDDQGLDICSKNIYVTIPYINIKYNKSIESEENNELRDKTIAFLGAGLVYSILIFIDSILLLPIYYYKSKKSLIPEIVYYILELIFLILIITNYNKFLFYPQQLKVQGCPYRNNSLSTIELYVSFYVLAARVFLLKTIRLLLCIKCIYKANLIKIKKNLQENELLKRKASTLHLNVYS